MDGVEEVYDQAAATPLVCGIVLHSFIIGQPHRLRPFRKALERIAELRNDLRLTTPGDIAETYSRQVRASRSSTPQAS